MKSILTLIALCAFVPVSACSSASDGDSPAPGGAPGSAGALANTAGAGVGGASAGSSSSGAATGGAFQAGSGGAPSAAGGPPSAAGSAGSSVGVAGNGAAGGSGAGAGPADGATLYTDNCGACHGAQGVGGTRAPEIQHPVRDYSAYVVRHGLPGTGFPAAMAVIAATAVSDAELTLIWDYLAKPAQPTTGAALYHDYCANCHGADGKGGPTGRNILSELGKLKSQVRSGAHLGQFGMRKDYMPAFTSAQISDAELNLIYTYVDSL